MPKTNTHICLKSLNTMQVACQAKALVKLFSLKQLAALKNHEHVKQKNFFILGGGSNILLPDQLDKLVIQVALLGKKLVRQDDTYFYLTVAAGESWHDLIIFCLQHKYYGLENLALIPGTVGAAPIQNIGAYGVEVKQFIDYVTVYDCQKYETFDIPASECDFSYRSSRFKLQDNGRYIILAVSFKLNKKPKFNLSYPDLNKSLSDIDPKHLTANEIVNAVISLRQKKLPDPKITPNAGSFFKNPIISQEQCNRLKQQHPNMPYYELDQEQVKLSAAWLIEQCGFKGKQLYGAQVSPQHALVLTNPNHCQSSAIKQLAQAIQQQVTQAFAISLDPEVTIVS